MTGSVFPCYYGINGLLDSEHNFDTSYTLTPPRPSRRLLAIYFLSDEAPLLHPVGRVCECVGYYNTPSKRPTSSSSHLRIQHNFRKYQ